MNGEFMSFFGENSYAYPAKVKQDLAKSNQKDVIVEINSPGGYTAPAAEIYTDLKNYPGNIEVHVVGEADSAVQEGFADGIMQFDNAKQNQIAEPMLNAAVTVPHFNAEKILEFKNLIAEKQKIKVKDENTKTKNETENLDKTKLVNHKLGLLFGGN